MADLAVCDSGQRSKKRKKKDDIPLDINTPDSKMKKIMLKSIKKKKGASTSKMKLKSVNQNHSFSYLNLSVQKETLKTNNRALAKNLAKVRQDLKAVTQENTELKGQLQALLIENARLQRVSGLRDSEIETEVSKRIQHHMIEVKQGLENVAQLMLTTSKSVSDLHDSCTLICRQSTGSFRGSSFGNYLGTPEDGVTVRTRRSIFPHGDQNSDHGALTLEDDYLSNVDEVMTNDRLRQEQYQVPSHNMSLILEQSVMEDGVTLLEPQGPITGLTSVLEKEPTEKKKKKVANVDPPQRIPCSHKEQKKTNKPTEENITGSISETAPQSHEVRTEAAISQNDVFLKPEIPTTSNKSLQDRRGTFVAPNPFVSTKTLPRSPCNEKTVSKDAEIGEKIDSLDFLAKLKRNLQANNSEQQGSEPPSFPDEQTMYFDCDMELTSVLDTAKLLPMMNKAAAERPHTTENDQVDSVGIKSKEENKGKQKLESSKAKESARSKHRKKEEPTKVDIGEKEKTVVELRINKPGKFVFSASRKENDGTRKPVPDKASSKSRSKPKINKEVQKSPERIVPVDRNLFDFGDRTPTAPLDKILKSSSIYDMSWNERAPKSPQKPVGKSTAAQIIRKNSMSEKDKEIASEPSSVYSVPLKGSPDSKSQKKRSRSKSSSRSKSRKTNEDEDFVPPRSRSRSKSRSRSLKADNSSDDSPVTVLRASRSKTRVKQNSVTMETEDSEVKSERCTRKSARSRSLARSTGEECANKDERPTEEEINTDEFLQQKIRRETFVAEPNSKRKTFCIENSEEMIKSNSDIQSENMKEKPFPVIHLTDVNHINIAEQSLDSSVYYIPLKGTPSPQLTKIGRRTRSRSRGRQAVETDDSVAKRARSRSRTRSQVSSEGKMSQEEKENPESRKSLRKSQRVEASGVEPETLDGKESEETDTCNGPSERTLPEKDVDAILDNMSNQKKVQRTSRESSPALKSPETNTDLKDDELKKNSKDVAVSAPKSAKKPTKTPSNKSTKSSKTVSSKRGRSEKKKSLKDGETTPKSSKEKENSGSGKKNASHAYPQKTTVDDLRRRLTMLTSQMPVSKPLASVENHPEDGKRPISEIHDDGDKDATSDDEHPQKRTRRHKVVSYVEKPLTAKLRRGDDLFIKPKSPRSRVKEVLMRAQRKSFLNESIPESHVLGHL